MHSYYTCSLTFVASSYSGQNRSTDCFWLLNQLCTQGPFVISFDRHFDHPQLHKLMLLPVKNGRLILTCKCTCFTYM